MQYIITVTSLDDSGPGTLRQAIADAVPGENIDFAVTGTITLTSGELVVTNDLTIIGPGATNLTISGNNASRVISLSNVTAAISGLTVANGRISTGSGAGINNSGGSLTISNASITANNANGSYLYYCVGVGIYSSGVLTVINSTIANNHGDFSSAGGLYSSGTLKLINSTLTANSGEDGGGMHTMGSCFITNSTISGNTGWPFYAYLCTVWLCNSTVSPNTSTEYSAWVSARSTLHVVSSIMAGKLYVNANGSAAISHDFNLIQNTNEATITGVTAHDIYGKDPLLGPLADNGGPTPTHALLPGSPAIDHGSSGGLATDQRGQPRIFNFPAYFDAADGSDIGAYELHERAQTGPLFTVNTTDDADDGVPGIAHCSLREAIAAANANVDTNTIDFAAEVPGLYTGVTGTITLTNGQLTVTNSVNINGPGATNLTVSGNNASRVFSFNNVTSTVSGLTVASGRNSGGYGAGIYNQGGSLTISACMVTSNINSSFGPGGGIFNSGALTLINSTASKNYAYDGGGIYNLNGTVTAINMIVASNEAYGAGGGILNYDNGAVHILASALLRNRSAYGSGIYNIGMLTLTNTTISGNGPSMEGGGIWSSGTSSNIIISSTICSNSSGGIYIAAGGGQMTIGNSIVSDCYTAIDSFIISQDHNLIQNTNGCTITNLTAHNIYNQDPKLGPLADLGGPTPTHALRFDSPAIDAGNSGGLTTDQRGLPRPIDSPDIANAEGGDGSDIGAYEADPNLRISGFGMTGADVWLSFNSLFGCTYKVERTDKLVPPVVWTPALGAEVVAGDGGVVTIIDPAGAGAPRRFYRLQLEAGPGAGGSMSALGFDGGDRVIIANNPALNPSTITVETWVSFGRLAYGNGYSPTDGQIFIAKGGDTTAGEYYLSQGGSSPTEHGIGFVIGASHVDAKWVGVTWPLETNRWYHIAGTYDGSSMYLFIDGQMAASNYVGTAVIGNSSPLYFGFNDAWPFYLTGRMDDIRIWSYARTESQIRAAMYSTLTGNEPGLAGYWDFNESADSQTVLDRTPNGCHGQLGSSMNVDADDPARILRGPVR